MKNEFSEDTIGDDLDFREGDALRSTVSSEISLPILHQNNPQNGALQNILQKLSTSIKEQDKEAAKCGSFIAATEPSFLARLDRAMEKNFEYILRKDSDPNFGKTGNDQGSSFKPNIPPKPPIRTAAGIGMIQQVALQVQESTSVYVNNLPSDITQEELEILFGSGQTSKIIKKIKIYTLPDGRKKGDALVTFFKSESAQTACIKLHNLNIGEGHIITVQRADFANKATPTEPEAEPAASHTATAANDKEVQALLYRLLPPESEGGRYPLALIRNAFQPQPPPGEDLGQYLGDVEAEMLIECCNYGKVRFIQLLCLSEVLSSQPDLLGQLDLLQSLDGAVVVSFDHSEAAEKCSVALADRWFDGSQLRTSLFLPPPITPLPSEQSQKLSKSIPPPPRPPPFPMPSLRPLTASNTLIVQPLPQEQQQQQEEEVDSFLNSLL